jgi:cytochrome P450
MKAPGPSPAEVVSQLPLILGDRLGWMERVHRKYGDVVRVPMGPRTIYAVFHPDHLRHVLVANAKNYWKGRTFEKTGAYMGKGLATTEGQAWQIQRRRMNPHFHRDAIRGLADVIHFNVDRMIERWSSERTVDLSLEFQRFAMETVARAMFGVGVPEAKIQHIIEAFKETLKYTTRRTLSPFDFPERLPLPSNRKFKKAVSFLDDIVYGIIREEQAAKGPSGTLLSMLVRATDPETGEKMSDKQLRDEVMTMFLGGTDTSGNTLSWVFTNLQRHPEVLARVRAEVDLLGGRKPGADDLDKLDYTRRTVEETLRLFPQNWVGSRDTLAVDSIGGFHIPAERTVFLGVYVVHRRPDFWENPLAFDPDRFLPDKLVGKHPLQYLPFGAGTRKCIGYNFAMMEICLCIARLLRTFQIEVLKPDAIRPYPTWSLWPKPGVPARLS